MASLASTKNLFTSTVYNGVVVFLIPVPPYASTLVERKLLTVVYSPYLKKGITTTTVSFSDSKGEKTRDVQRTEVQCRG